MRSPRWTKLVRDVAASPGRFAMIGISLAAGVAAFATMLSAFALLTRELPRNYLATRPPSASLDVDGIDEALLAAVRARPGIAAARGSGRVRARVQGKGGEWRPLTLYVADDLGHSAMNLVSQEEGAWPPPRGTIALEREALPLVAVPIGQSLVAKTGDGVVHHVPLSGSAHDPSVPAPGQGEIVSGYATLETAALLGETGRATTLAILVRDHPYDAAVIEREVTALVTWLRGEGHRVTAIRIPPPGEHPHQRIMTSMLALLLAFSVVALALGALLAAAMTDMLLAEQRRAIGVLRALGARSMQIGALYGATVAGIALLATLAGGALGVSAGRAFATVTLTRFLNFEMTDAALPAWTLGLIFTAGVFLPLLAALPALRRASRVTVAEALADLEAKPRVTELALARAVTGRLTRGVPLLSLRNLLLRPQRLWLSLGLLAAAGATFVSSGSARRGAQQHLEDAAAERHYDLEVFLDRPRPAEYVAAVLAGTDGVQGVVPWRITNAAPTRPDGLAIERAYPDGSHGTLTLAAVPASGAPFSVAMRAGRWIEPGERDSVVLNEEALEFFPGAAVGDVLGWTARGESLRLRVVGIARQRMVSAAGYVSAETFTQRVDPRDEAAAYRVVLRDHTPDALRSAAERIERALGEQRIATRFILTETMLRREIGGHYNLLIGALVFIAALMGVVGGVGLFSTMSVQVLERRREFGVLRAVGGTSRMVIAGVLVEGIVVGIASGALALGASFPLSALLGAFVGTVAAGVPFTALPSVGAMAACLAVVTLGAALASAPAALHVARVPLRQLLEG